MIKLALEEHFNWNDSRIMIYVVPGNPVVPVDPVIPVPDTINITTNLISCLKHKIQVTLFRSIGCKIFKDSIIYYHSQW